jgi:ArsR family transcriptional regulator
MKPKTASTASLHDSARLFKAFADPVRLRLLNLLAEDREVCVCHLHEALGLPQPTVSRHLAYLRKRGLVVGRKEGLWVYYRMAKPGSSLHRALVASLDSCLGERQVFRVDRLRLSQGLSSCSQEP